MRTSGFISVDASTRLFYETAGSGPLDLILVPGWTMSTRVFEHQLACFEHSERVRVIALDPRAQGRSSNSRAGHDYEQHGVDLGRFVGQMEVRNMVLCGWSFGTLAILAYLNQFGIGGLCGLIMLDGPPRAAANNTDMDWATYRYDDADRQQAFYTRGRLRDPASTNRRFAEWMLEDANEDHVRWVLGITEQMPDEAAALLNATSVFLDYTKDLIALDGQVPLLYLMRESEGERVRNWAERYTPSARVEAFGEHLMFWERPTRTNRLLQDFLKDCTADAGG